MEGIGSLRAEPRWVLGPAANAQSYAAAQPSPSLAPGWVPTCGINLSPDKLQMSREAFRVLKPGGRLAISDVVATVKLPEEMRSHEGLVAGCVGNASVIEELDTIIAEAGFTRVRIAPKDESREFIRDWAPGRGVEDYVVSATIEAVTPGN